jgi:hypothetical protein
MNKQSKSAIVLHRLQDSFGEMRTLSVFINNQKVGGIPYSEQRVFHLDPGIYNVQVRMDWCRSKPLQVELYNNESLDLYCGSRFVGKRWILNLVALFFCPRNFFLVGTKPNINILTPEDDRQRRAKRLAFVFTPLLMIPLLTIFRIIEVQVVEASMRFGALADIVAILLILLYLIIVVLSAIYFWRWLKDYFARHPPS